MCVKGRAKLNDKCCFFHYIHACVLSPLTANTWWQDPYHSHEPLNCLKYFHDCWRVWHGHYHQSKCSI